MTIQAIISDLKKTGVNSKQQVIDKLSNLSKEDLLELRQSINERLCKMEEKEEKQ